MAYEAIESYHPVIVKLNQAFASMGAIEKPMPDMTGDLKYTRAERKAAMNVWATGAVQHKYAFDAVKPEKWKTLDQLMANYIEGVKGISHYYVWFYINPGTTIVQLYVFLWGQNMTKKTDDAKSDAA